MDNQPSGIRIMQLDSGTIWYEATCYYQALENILLSGELEENRVCSILEHATLHGTIIGKTQTNEVRY